MDPGQKLIDRLLKSLGFTGVCDNMYTDKEWVLYVFHRKFTCEYKKKKEPLKVSNVLTSLIVVNTELILHREAVYSVPLGFFLTSLKLTYSRLMCRYVSVEKITRRQRIFIKHTIAVALSTEEAYKTHYPKCISVLEKSCLL